MKNQEEHQDVKLLLLLWHQYEVFLPFYLAINKFHSKLDNQVLLKFVQQRPFKILLLK